MKKLNIISSLLYSERSMSFASNKQSKRRLLNYLFCQAIFLCMLFSSMQVKADTTFSPTNDIQVSVPLGSAGLDYIQFRVLEYDNNGYPDAMKSCQVYYEIDGQKTYTQILSYGTVINGWQVSTFGNNYNSATNGYICGNDSVILSQPTSLEHNEYSTSSKANLYIANYRWYYPKSMAGKKVIVQVNYDWERDEWNGSSRQGTSPYTEYRTLTLPTYNPAIPSLSLTSNNDGTFNFAWSNADIQNLTRFIVYSDSTFTTKVDSTNVSAAKGQYKIKLPILNTKGNNNFYVKQVFIPYQAPSTPKRYESLLTLPVTIPGYQFPASLSGTYSVSNQSVSLLWINGNVAGLGVSYHITRNGTFITPPAGISVCNFIDTGITNWTNYTYIVYAVPSGWTRDNGLISQLSSTITVSTSPNKPDLSAFKLTAYPTNGTILPYMVASWDPTQWVSQNVVKLYHRASTSTTFALVGTMTPGTSSYTDNSSYITDNSQHFYKLEVTVFDASHIYADTINQTIVKQVSFKSMNASKNTIGDRIQLVWEIDSKDLCDRFEIYRSFTSNIGGKDVNSDPELVNQLVPLTTYNTWDDLTAAPGIVYTYWIKAYKTGQDGITRETDSRNDIGFRMPTGIVTGRITYGGGTAVGDVSLYVNTSLTDKNLLYKSLKFIGDKGQTAAIGLTKAQHGCIENGFSFQSWITSTRPTTYTPVMEVSKEYSIGIRNDSVLVFIGSTFNVSKASLKCKLDSTITENKYFQLSVTLDSNGSLKVYFNGKPQTVATVNVGKTTTCSFIDQVLDAATGNVVTPRTNCYLGNKTNASTVNESAFSGNIDDVRLWSRALTDAEVLDDYNRYLGGNETGLIGYWPLDEGINSYAFDCSKTNQSYNGHHIILTDIFTSDSIPTKEQLAIKGLTDTNGNYIIRGIPFSGDGSTYAIQPVLGTHTFNPTQQVCYISPSSLVHDAQNFEDKSSFPVTVKVTYNNTDFPVPGVSFSVDGLPCSSQNKLITTRSDVSGAVDAGECVIDVPIGEHYIQASLAGHVFTFGGRYPSVGSYTFDEDSSTPTIFFHDSTLVSVTGRVVGGLVEAAYPIGFKQSHANIGKATITLEPTLLTNYNFTNKTGKNPNDTLITLSTNSARFGSKAIMQGRKVRITTDATTGEYMVMVPPVQWTVDSVNTSTTKAFLNDQSLLPVDATTGLTKCPSFTTNPMITASDTTTNILTNKKDTFTYNFKKSFMYRALTQVTVRDGYNGTSAFGEKRYLDTSGATAVSTILYDSTSTGGTPDKVKYYYGKPTSSSNGKPIFLQNGLYGLNIRAFERYLNPEKFGSDSISIVPLKGAVVTVQNEIGILQKPAIAPTTPAVIPTDSLETDANGYALYPFMAGFPNLTGDYTGGLGLNITVKNGTDNAVPWTEMGNFRGIVLGSEPVLGTDFVTKGPIVPLIVLRDPPGSNSYAYVTKGTSLSYTFSYKNTGSGNETVDAKLSLGATITTEAGNPFFMINTKVAVTNDYHEGLDQTWSAYSGNTRSNTLDINETVQTSSDPAFVGSNADVYIGNSTNYFYCTCNYLGIAGGVLGQRQVQTGNLVAGTDFRFSQNEILTAQIPQWQNMMKSKMTFRNDTIGYQHKANTDNINYYITKLQQNDDTLGLNPKSYTIIRPVQSPHLTNQIDTIATSILGWRNVIRINEALKDSAGTNTNYSVDNISFDAGAQVARSYTYTDQSGSQSGNSNETQAVIGDTYGAKVDDNGVEASVEIKEGGGNSTDVTSGSTNSTSFGFVLSAPNSDNRFSVNVYKNAYLSTTTVGSTHAQIASGKKVDPVLGSYIFQVVGGQSSCPYQAADSTVVLKINNKKVQLSNATVALDAPYMEIPSYTKTDVPNGKEANFVLQLGSNSPVTISPRAYMLSVDDASNPNGAIISVDGTPLTGGRLFYVTSGPNQILTKTLTLKQTRLDVLDYQGIKLNFSSPCGDIIATKVINVTYVPSCSDLDLVIDRQIVNTVNSGPLSVTMKNFNQDYKNFLGLEIDYKVDGAPGWSSKIFAKDKSDSIQITQNNLKVDFMLKDTLASTLTYKLSLDGLYDGNYQIQARTLCANGQVIINNVTPVISVLKDMVPPTSMGVPSPSNGILTPETEVSVTFNKDIQTGMLSSKNFDVEGVLNGATLQHSEGLALDGTAKSEAFTESSLSLQNSSFSIEGWIRAASDCNTLGTVFSIGQGADQVLLQMKKDAIQVQSNNQTFSYPIDIMTDWQYVSLSYNVNTTRLQVNLVNSKDGNNHGAVLSQILTKSINPVGRLTVGSGFKGNIHQVVAWNTSRSIGDLSDINVVKSGTELNLVGYWPLDEATGTLAADKVRGRNMTVNSSWFIEPNGKSVVFNGVNQSAVINQPNPLTTQNNFSLEFWFKGKAQTNATLFSCGKGTTDLKPVNSLSVGFDATGALNLYSNGNGYIVPNVTVLDTIWHHFALSVKRGANTNVYIDGQQMLQLSSDKIGGMGSDKMSLGSRSFNDSSIVDTKKVYTFTQDQYFNGMMDEFRIWNSALSAGNIRLDMHSRLLSSDSALVAYYPFEEYILNSGGVAQMQFSLNDLSFKKSGLADYSNYNASTGSSDNTPGIKVARPKQAVSYSYTASNNKIVFNINEPLKTIENCTLEFTINTLLDLNGNTLVSPIKWTAFVNNNQLLWVTDNVNLIKQVLDPATFTTDIVNNSGQYENYVIDGLPSWLSVDKSSGTLNPLQKTELTFTVDPATNIGSYESRIILTGNNGIQEMLPISMQVTGTRPNWSVNPYDYDNSMNVIGKIQINGVYQEDPEDLLAAFKGDTCVGIVNPQFDKNTDSYIAYMDIYGRDADTGKPLTFSLWDASTGRIYPDVDVVGDSIKYVSGVMVGTLNNPKIFNATNKIEQQLNLKQGWNWISSNVVNTHTSLYKQFISGIGTSGIELKSVGGFRNYTDTYWSGNLDSLQQTYMYMLKTNQARTLKFVGTMADPADYALKINSGWNWIGYIPQFVAPVTAALSNLSAKDGDQIKGQIGFASYSGGVWYGSLQYMMPGLGYMYNYNEPDKTKYVNFNYPSQYISSTKVAKLQTEAASMKWAVDVTKYQLSMTVTGVVLINNVETTNSDLQLGVFIGDECRGTISLQYVEAYKRYMAFMMIWGNASDVNSKITFKSFNPTDNSELVSVNPLLGFIPDNITGSPVNPFEINFKTILGINDLDMTESKIYPNPVINQLYFNYDPSGIEELEIIDNVGCRLVGLTHVTSNSIDVSRFAPGAYILRIKYHGNIYMHRFIRK